MKHLALISALVLSPLGAWAQGSTLKIDCSAYHKNLDGLWTVIRPNTIVVDGKSVAVDLTRACCFGADTQRLAIGSVNIIRMVEKACY
jgi:hypothetical protein